MNKKVIFGKKNVLVTGGAGFIGSHLCDELIKSANVICLDNFSTGDEKNIDHLLAEPDFEFIRHDICEPIELNKLPELQKFKIEFQGIQEIYHLACPMSPRDFINNAMPIIMANSYGVKNALDIAVKYQAKFLHFSSSVVYGQRRQENSPILENDLGMVDILSERSSYDEGKRFAETIVANYRRTYKLDAKIIRLFRIYGPRMKLNDGQMIPDFISQALDNKELVIYGDSGFSSTFCYISDAIDAVTKLMESDISGPVNIGSDVLVNLTDLARKVIAIIGSDSKINYQKELLFMSPLCLPDIAKARNELGWMPVIPLDKGLERTIYELRASKGLKGVEKIIK
ncbi:MAG: GDP-mannose 4,6-dehydratase [Planctomycetes bacterium]|jgi:UDP-glucuronate decarboxylase|nr:GDP-mannose 4,6-dehydratase [Planctomycetota bacterium]